MVAYAETTSKDQHVKLESRRETFTNQLEVSDSLTCGIFRVYAGF